MRPEVDGEAPRDGSQSFSGVSVGSVDELLYELSRRRHQGIALSSLCELGTEVARMCIREQRVLLHRGVVYPPVDVKQASSEFRRLWTGSAPRGRAP